MTNEIKLISSLEIEKLKNEYAKSNLFFNNSTHVYFGYYQNNTLVGFSGLMLFKNKTILKNSFVLKDHRRKGIYSALSRVQFDYICDLGIKIIEGNMTTYSLYYHLSKGAKIIKKYKSCTKIRYEL